MSFIVQGYETVGMCEGQTAHKIAIGGKGGVGKTTVCAVWSQLFAADGFSVLAIDADSNINLC